MKAIDTPINAKISQFKCVDVDVFGVFKFILDDKFNGEDELDTKNVIKINI